MVGSHGLPVVVLPYLNAAQAEHPALGEAIERLRHIGARVMFGPDVLPLHRPRQGNCISTRGTSSSRYQGACPAGDAGAAGLTQ